MATNQFHDVADTTVGTTHGSRSNTFQNPPNGILVRNNNANPKPTAQDPNTPTTVNTRVNHAACQNAGCCTTFT
ncbi:hypothetical protein GCM10027568_36320 [Humibacter soli]